MKYCFGIDIGGTTVKIGLFSASSEMLARWEIPTRKDSSPDGLLRDVKTALEGCLTERGISRTDVLGVGITAPGPVTEDGILHGSAGVMSRLAKKRKKYCSWERSASAMTHALQPSANMHTARARAPKACL